MSNDITSIPPIAIQACTSEPVMIGKVIAHNVCFDTVHGGMQKAIGSMINGTK